MKVTLYGAAKEVTGSMSLLEVNGLKILVDCGLVQTNDFIKDMVENAKPFSFDPAEIDYCIVTHAHIDHCGLIPLLVKRGLKAPILATEPTMNICSIALVDCAYIWKREAERYNKNGSNRYKNHKVKYLTPIYSQEDAQDSITRFRGYGYDRKIVLNDNVSFYFRNAGHILGAASLEFEIKQEYKNKTILFTGDVSGINDYHPFIKSVDYVKKANYVICESTYGDRKHKKENTIEKLKSIIQKTCFENKKTTLIASFSVQRLQEIIWYLYKVYSENPEFSSIPIYVDTPMGIKVTLDVYCKSLGFFNEEAKDLFEKDRNIFNNWENLKFVSSHKQSLALNNGKPKIIIASAGMMQAGRITNHIESFIPSKGCSVVLCGYCAIGTFGRRLMDAYDNNNTKIKSLSGKQLNLKANFYKLSGLSGHADMDGLTDYMSNIKNLKTIIINHGEINSSEILKSNLNQKLSADIIIPNKNQTINLK